MPSRYDIFVSHSSKNRDQIRIIVKYLEDRGLTCFCAEDNIPIASDWPKYIVSALKNSRLFLYIHTKEATQSEEVQRELYLAHKEIKRKVFCYRLSDSELEGNALYFCAQNNWINSLNSTEEGLETLFDALSKELPARKREKEPEIISKPTKTRLLPILVTTLLLITTVFAGALVYKIDVRRFQSLLSQIEFRAGDKSLLEAFGSLEKAQRISRRYRLTPLKKNLTIDYAAYRKRLVNEADSIRRFYTNHIQSYYKSYLIYPSEDIRNAILDELEYVFSLDSVIAISNDDSITEIHKALTQ